MSSRPLDIVAHGALLIPWALLALGFVGIFIAPIWLAITMDPTMWLVVAAIYGGVAIGVAHMWAGKRLSR